MAQQKQPPIPKPRCSRNCKDHLFIISHSHDPKYDCQVTFCPKYYRQPKIPENTYPSFNFDQKEYTSAFILGVDRKALAKNEKQEEAEYKRQVSQALQKSGEIVFPKPRKGNNRCGVCKNEFEGYFKHIMSQSHKQKIIQNQYNNLIVKLSSQYNNLHGSEASAPIKFVSSTGDQAEAVQNEQKDITSFSELIISNDFSGELCESYNTSNKESPNKVQIDSTIAAENPPSGQSESNTFKNTLKMKQSEQHSAPDRQEKQVESSVNDSDSDSVQIVKVKPAKKPKNDPKPQDSHSKLKSINTKSKKKKSLEKKDKKKTKSKKDKKKKSKSKSKKKKQKEDQSEQESEAMRRRRNSIKRRPLDPPPSNPPLIHRKMMGKATPFRGGQRPAHPAEVRPQQVLIQKYVVQDPILDISMQKILSNLCNSISKGPPALAPRQYRRADDSSLPKSIMRSRINIANQGNHQNSNELEQPKQKSIDKELWTSRDRSEGSLSESAVTNTALTHRKVDLNQNPITPILSALPVPAKAKPSIFSSILQDEKNRKNTEVIEVAGEDSELSQTKSVTKLKGSTLQQASPLIKNTISGHNFMKMTDNQPARIIAQLRVNQKEALYQAGDNYSQNSSPQSHKALTFSKPSLNGVLFRKKLQNNGEIKSIGVIDLSLEQQGHVCELMKLRKGALKEVSSWGDQIVLPTMNRNNFIVSKKD